MSHSLRVVRQGRDNSANRFLNSVSHSLRVVRQGRDNSANRFLRVAIYVGILRYSCIPSIIFS
ncbi:hypothetical protein DLM76_06650 [Leptospira yasudae]|nr:hypothetical protein DLM76_06650 [Leptospira yasudae]